MISSYSCLRHLFLHVTRENIRIDLLAYVTRDASFVVVYVRQKRRCISVRHVTRTPRF